MSFGAPTLREENFLQGIPVPTDPEKIDQELVAMWKSAEQDAARQHVESVVRVASGTVVWMGSTAETTRVRRMLTRIVERYPSRVILVEVTDATDGLDAYVNAQCFVAAPGEPEVCCEVIHFRIGATVAPFAGGLVAPLLLADVPATLWYFAPGPSWRAGVEKLAVLVDRVITEVSTERDPAAALEALLGRAKPTFTLSWFRLRRLRERIAALFDGEAEQAALPHITSLSFRYCQSDELTAKDARVGSALISGWMALRLGWTARADGQAFDRDGEPVAVSVVCTRQAPRGGLEQVEITCRGGERFLLELGPADGGFACCAREGDACVMPDRKGRCEIEEAESLGVAFSRRASDSGFHDSVCLCLPMLRNLLRGAA